jgi:alkylation response protein AidB-like acyl-CoA dehydrogenase
MHFAYDEDQELLRSSTRRFLESRHPVASVRSRLEQPDILDRDVWRGGAGLGWTAMLVAEEYDGGSITDQPLVDLAAVAEELGRQLYPGPVLATNVVADAIGALGTDAQRKEHLGAIAHGDTVATWCLTGDGTVDADAVDVQLSTAESKTLRLEGSARFVHDAHVADLLLVTATGPGGLSLVLVPTTTAGVRSRPMGTIDLTRRFCEVRFDGVEVPLSNLLGEVGRAASSVERALCIATVVQAAEAVGAAERLLETTVQYAKDRVQFGRPIGSFQAIKHRLADLLVLLEAARAAARFAALAVADHRNDRDEAVAVAGSFVREAFAHLCGESLQLCGGVGFTWEHDVHLFLRRAKTDQVLFGDPAWHRERLVSIIEAVEEQH